MTPEITICILHYDKIDRLKNTIEKIKRHTDSDYRIKILNNGFVNKRITNYLNSISNSKKITVEFNNENVGCPPGRNKLLKKIDT